MKNLKKYKVEFIQTQKYVVDLYAKNEEDAIIDGTKKFEAMEEQGIAHYNEIGDPETVTGIVYDVTNTDDPFNP